MNAALDAFFRGALFGVAIAAPVGPIGVLCTRRTLARGRRAGFVSGLGAATADALYGAVAALGLTAVSSLLLAYRLPVRVIGGLFLLGLGLRTLRSRPASETPSAPSPQSLAADYTSTLALTLTNPVTVVAFVGVFAGLGVGTGTNALALVAGVFCGSAAWWLLLALGVGALRERVTPRAMRLVNVAAGLLLVGFGIAVLVSLA
jgi:threonine/homoserine/homoserine lactone efflux protein